MSTQPVTPAVDLVVRHLPETTVGALAEPLRPFVERWITRTGTQDAALAGWREARYERLIARMYPHADLPTLQAAGAAVLWLFLVDGQLDPGNAGAHARYARLFAERTAALVSDRHDLPEPADPLLHCPWETAQDFSLRQWPLWRTRLLGHMAEFAESMHAEVRERVADRVPTVEEYLKARWTTSGWPILVDFAELAARTHGGIGHRTGEVLRRSPDYVALLRAGGDVTFGVNDILSLPKERQMGEYHNLVLLTRREHGLSLPAALARVEEWIGRRMQEYLDRRRVLLGTMLPFTRRQDVEGCVAAVDALVRGTVDWSVETGRYKL
ncbi:terpene synthase family protein [Streptomyces sp. ODS05-4]|uniref:terpene synthase family protein n=1 Tax=Streptomyces sp. ODS05-4 TaxID=2944939 RepID=UPI00210B8E06|nr:terpene synthase family protein [Streptomyces sp. ODS05-4]